MSEIRDNLRYTKTHEWVDIRGKRARVGITDHAQKELTDIVFVELPEIGKEVKKGEEVCTIESVKSVEEIYSPLTGKIVAVNEDLADSPEKINKSPYDEGWLFEIEIQNEGEIDELLTPEDYKKIIS
ncbi:MAG: glycine cleavage system protein GcvH [Thermoplasmata archaeon]|mgnify:CR=1 FL=1|nr:MAG: glycine cleavage system protein GcvH [Thermoplasmata archaeon]HDO69102.1 glycine cleavage system protein GcvH [Thermoplasmatales archaeon]HEX17017.1 glycine cleavage system protein GcvH [Thermoplasmatales archaeon]